MPAWADRIRGGDPHDGQGRLFRFDGITDPDRGAVDHPARQATLTCGSALRLRYRSAPVPKPEST